MKEQEVYISIKKSELDQILMRLEYQSQKINELEQRLSKTSKNSSKPPSSDGYKKEVKNNRIKSGRKQGGQKGHKGSTLKATGTPDIIQEHKVSGTCGCGQDLSKLPLEKTHTRQVFDLPSKLLEVTEHRIEVKQCLCGKSHEAYCAHTGTVQYGPKIKALATYMNQYQLLPYERTQEFMRDVIGISIGDGTLEKANLECYNNLERTEINIKQALINARVLHSDETGMRSKGKTKWVHSASTKTHTHYQLHDKRGKEAMDDIGILGKFEGTGVHDRWASYEKYGFEHAYCNAHILRDLKYLHENMGEGWAGKMAALLCSANELKNEGKLTNQEKDRARKGYDRILEKAIKTEKAKSENKPIKAKRGRPPTSKALRMINMLHEKHKEVLRFLYFDDVPFDNNLAERDLRMVKLRQKISGCFRSDKGQKSFFRIRSYISTARKQGHQVFEALELAIIGSPLNIT